MILTIVNVRNKAEFKQNIIEGGLKKTNKKNNQGPNEIRKSWMITALVKHRRTAQHSTDRRGQTNHCLISIHIYTHIAGNLDKKNTHRDFCTFRFLCSGCFKSEMNLLQQFPCPVCRRGNIYQHYEAPLSDDEHKAVRVRCYHSPASSAGTELLGKCWDKSVQSAGVERHLVTDPGQVLENLQFPPRSGFNPRVGAFD